jgi:hypothetical protein
MQLASRVQRTDAVAELPERSAKRWLRRSGEALHQRLPRHQLQREAPTPGVLEQLVQAHQIRMLHVCETAKLLLDSIDRVW